MTRSGATPRKVLAALESAAARLGVRVRVESFLRGVLDGRGGLCWVDGQAIVLMDEKLSVPDRVVVLADALAQLDLDASDVPLLALEAVRASRLRAKARVRAKRKPRRAAGTSHPGLARARPRKGSSK